MMHKLTDAESDPEHSGYHIVKILTDELASCLSLIFLLSWTSLLVKMLFESLYLFLRLPNHPLDILAAFPRTIL